MKRFISIVTLFCFVASTFAANVTFNFADFVTNPQALRRVNIQPLSTPGVSGNLIISSDRISYTNDASGNLTISNMVAGSFRIELVGPFTTTAFQITVPTNSGDLNASNLVSTALVQANATTAYAIAAANSIFLAKTNLAITNAVDVLTNGLIEGQGLLWNASIKRWTNATPAAAGASKVFADQFNTNAANQIALTQALTSVSLRVTNWFSGLGTFTNQGNAVVGGSVTATNASRFLNSLTIGTNGIYSILSYNFAGVQMPFFATSSTNTYLSQSATNGHFIVLAADNVTPLGLFAESPPRFWVNPTDGATAPSATFQVAGTASISGNITNSALTASKLVLSGTGKQLTSSSFAESDLTTALTGTGPFALRTSGTATNFQPDTITVGTSQTNSYLTASQFIATDANKKLVSTINGNSLTNLAIAAGSGITVTTGATFMTIASSGGSAPSFSPFFLTNGSTQIEPVANGVLTNLSLWGPFTNNGQLYSPGATLLSGANTNSGKTFFTAGGITISTPFTNSGISVISGASTFSAAVTNSSLLVQSGSATFSGNLTNSTITALTGQTYIGALLVNGAYTNSAQEYLTGGILSSAAFTNSGTAFFTGTGLTISAPVTNSSTFQQTGAATFTSTVSVTGTGFLSYTNGLAVSSTNQNAFTTNSAGVNNFETNHTQTGAAGTNSTTQQYNSGNVLNSGNLTNSGAVYGTALTASQFIATDANKQHVSTLNAGTLTNLNALSTTGGVWMAYVPGFAMFPGDSQAGTYVTNTPSAGPTIQAYQMSVTASNNVLIKNFILPYDWDGGPINVGTYFFGGTNTQVSKVTNVWGVAASAYNAALGTTNAVTNVTASTAGWETNVAPNVAITIGGSPHAGHPITIMIETRAGSPMFSFTNTSYFIGGATIWGYRTNKVQSAITLNPL